MRWLAGMLFLSLAFAGCMGAPGDEDGQEQAPPGVLWDRGLADGYSTPGHVAEDDAAERRAAQAPPGDPRFAQFDQTMLEFMETYDIPAGQLALMHNGALIYASGYGFTREDGTGSANGSTLFRMASVTKPITRAIVTLQVEQGLYNWTDPVFCLSDSASNCRLPFDPLPNHPVVDDRIAAITVQHLVDHEAGWGSEMNKLHRPEGTEEMRELMGFEGAPTPWHVAHYLMGSELRFDPGGSFSYCGACYILAGLVAEAATGAELGAIIDAYLARPLDLVGDLAPGRSLPEARDPREPFYNDEDRTPSVYDPNQTVRQPDGGVNFDVLSTAGGLIGTAEAIATVYSAYPESVPPRATVVDGEDPYQASHERRGHSGLIDGSSALSVWARDRSGQSGVIQFVVLFNDSGPNSEDCESVETPTGITVGACPMLVLHQNLMNLAAAKAYERSTGL